MTNGAVIVLGETGVNFGAGMSGGFAIVLDENNTFKDKYNCYVVGYTEDVGREIADILMKPVDENILQNAKLLLKDHIDINYLD